MTLAFSDQTLLSYAVYDVFTETAFGGNPLAVVFDADALSSAQMQVIAREFNFSETVFVLSPKDPNNTANLRIFTPTQELPFAGHPTIGAAVALADKGFGPALSLELKVGVLPAHAANGAASFVASQALDIIAHPDRDLIAQVLGVKTSDIATAPVLASMGVPFTFTELTSRAALSNIDIDLPAMKRGRATYPTGLDFSQAAYWRDADAGTDDHDVVHIRMFAPLDNITEDPATGSAAAALANLMSTQTGAPVNLTLYQGQDMGRPSVISAQATPTGVTISGPAVQVMQGQLRSR